MSSPRLRTLLIAGSIFLVGLIVGSGLTAIIGVRFVKGALNRPVVAPALAERAANRISRDIVHEFDLTPAQAIAVNRELRATGARIRQARIHYISELADEARASAERIAALLPEEKRAAFREVAQRRFEKLGLQRPPAPPVEATP